MTDDAELPFHLARNAGFGMARPEDDYLHTHQNAAVGHETLTETQYFSFSIPEAKIHSNLYLWHHPNLGVVSGGAWVWQGSKRHPVEAEINDFRLFMRDDPLKNDLHEYRLLNGYGVKVIEPLKRHRVTYDDPERRNSFDLEYEALISCWRRSSARARSVGSASTREAWSKRGLFLPRPSSSWLVISSSVCM